MKENKFLCGWLVCNEGRSSNFVVGMQNLPEGQEDIPMVTSIKVTLIVPPTLPQAFPSIKVTLKCDVVFPQWISHPLGEALNLVK